MNEAHAGSFEQTGADLSSISKVIARVHTAHSVVGNKNQKNSDCKPSWLAYGGAPSGQTVKKSYHPPGWFQQIL